MGRDRMCKKWSKDELQRAHELHSQGVQYWKIAEELGRTHNAVRHKLDDTPFTPEQIETRRLAAQKHRRERGEPARIHPNGWSQIATRPSADLIAERDRRSAMMPRDLTAALCGDPLPGYSALERRA